MKISLDRSWRPGVVWVRGSRVCKVAHDHQVPTKMQNIAETGEKRRTFDAPWVTAKVGDLAVEVVAVKTGNVMGFSYISGDAIALNRYTDTPSHWFVEAKALKLNFADEYFIEEVFAKRNAEAMFHGLVTANNDSKADVIVFDTEALNAEDANNCWSAIADSLKYVPAGMTDDEAIVARMPLWIGCVNYPPKKQLQGVCQPAFARHEFPPNGFQINMLTRMELPLITPWKPHD